ncbi:MAG: heparinase, partial [Acetobacteraceae bacterium]|nr:heparinase [Acetobacteraceae bacterium]
MTLARMPALRGRVPDGPALPVRDPWPGDPARGARLLRGELEQQGAVIPLAPGAWGAAEGWLGMPAHGFTWLRDLRALGTDAARTRARALVADWIRLPSSALARRPDVTGSRIAAWLGHYDFVAASADDVFRARMMSRLVSDARALAARLPAEEPNMGGLTALKGLIAAAVALPDQQSLLVRALRFLPQEIE